MALKGKYEHAHWAVKIIQWLGCMFLLSIVAGVSILFFEQPLSTGALKWIQFVQQIALFLLPPLCVAYLWSNKPLEWLRAYPLPLPKGKGVKIGIWAMTLMLVALPAINLLGYWNQQLTLPAFLEPLEQWMKTQEESAKILTEQFMSTTTLIGLICNLLLMAVLPAMAEELTFRGVLQRLFEPTHTPSLNAPQDISNGQLAIAKRVPHLAIWCSAILFSAIHLQFYGFVPRMLMGALFGYMLVWTGSLWIPILMHFTNNAMAVILYFVALRQGWDMDKVDAIGTNDTLWLGVVSIVITIIGIYAFRRSTTMSKASSRISSGN